MALNMASPLASPSIYGVSTTTEWVVREFIEDVENNPTIYNGLPLRTEFRIFVDFDTDEILGMNPYWDKRIMTQRFAKENDANTAQNIHDYVTYMANADKLDRDYENNKDIVSSEIKRLIPFVNLNGQWSIDIMKNGEDFYIIDMATAATSALSHCVPKNKIKAYPENWIPTFQNLIEE